MRESFQNAAYLRDIVATEWEQLQGRCLGWSLRDMARHEGRSIRAYLWETRRTRWGGYREAVLLAKKYGATLRVWSMSGELLIYLPAIQVDGRQPMDLCYTGSHYLSVTPSWSTWRGAAPQILVRRLESTLASMLIPWNPSCGGDSGLEKNVKQRRGRAQHSRRRVGCQKMSPIWWAETARGFQLALL